MNHKEKLTLGYIDHLSAPGLTMSYDAYFKLVMLGYGVNAHAARFRTLTNDVPDLARRLHQELIARNFSYQEIPGRQSIYLRLADVDETALVMPDMGEQDVIEGRVEYVVFGDEGVWKIIRRIFDDIGDFEALPFMPSYT